MATTTQKQVGLEMVNKNEKTLSAGQKNPSNGGTGSVKFAKNISWANVNYTVGNKKVLSDCWGKVNFHLYLFYLHTKVSFNCLRP